MSTNIEWTQETINPLVGCSKVSESCANCYAEKMAWRLKNIGMPNYQKVVDGNGWTGKLSIDWSQLDKPLKWKKPRKVFIGSMTDMFHESIDVDSNFYGRIMHRIRYCQQHTFMMLTKRPQRMQWVFENLFNNKLPSNLWLGVTAENQKRADERIPILLDIPATVRFVSVEPMLGPVDFEPDYENACLFGEKIDWIICGGESGPGARPVHPDWVRSLRDQCASAGVPFLFKQWGGWAGFYSFPPGSDLLKSGVFNLETAQTPFGINDPYAWPIGKKKAGRLLDGKLWDQYPKD